MGFLIKSTLFLLILSALLFAENALKPKLVHLSYENIPKEIYKNQIFSVRINSLVALDEFYEINTTFENSQNIEFLNPKNSWSIKDSNHLSNKFYFKALSNDAKLPDITISLNIDENRIESDKLDGEKLNIININEDMLNFSKILANKLEVKKYKVNKYDDEYNIIVIELEALNGNLKDFHIGGFSKQGIESIVYTMPYTKAFYYAVIPNQLRVFEFVYYNLVTKKFIKESLSITVDDDRVSTQSDLNPKVNDFTIYKLAIILIFSLFFIILFVVRKRVIYILLAVIGIIYIIYISIPQENIRLKRGTNIYLLPTKNSTIFFITNRSIEVKKLKSRFNYIKILLPNDKIGWIRSDDVKN